MDTHENRACGFSVFSVPLGGSVHRKLYLG
jgi:hypothetical protein